MTKTNFRLIVPMVGKGSRFSSMGFAMPKPLIMVDDRTIIEHSMGSFSIPDTCELIFIVRSEHVTNFAIDKFLKLKFGEKTKVVSVDKETRGSVETVLEARGEFEDQVPMAVWCSDVFFGDGKFTPEPKEVNRSLNYTLTTKANSPGYSYIKSDNRGLVTLVAEKKVISEQANLGYYAFESGKLFCEYADKMIKSQYLVNGEFYLAPLYNLLISDGLRVTFEEIGRSHFFGTPKEMEFYRECVLKRFGHGKIALAADHSGYELKEALKVVLGELGLDFVDCGAFSDSPSDYATYSKVLIEGIKRGDCSHGFLLCRSANGQAIFANKFKHIRCAYVFDEWTAKHSVEHNCANVFAIPSHYVKGDLLKSIVETLKKAEFQGGRHENRVRQILDL